MTARLAGAFGALILFRLAVIAYAGAVVGNAGPRGTMAYVAAGVIGHLAGAAVDLAVQEYKRRARRPDPA
jgi:hypothetical protein